MKTDWDEIILQLHWILESFTMHTAGFLAGLQS
jgi:hypothetical protein